MLRADLRAVSSADEPPVMRNITLAPKYGGLVKLAAPLRAPEELIAPAAAAAG